MLLSDTDIRAELDAERIQLDPFDESMIQPSSVDVRLERMFRLFDNHKYAHIDPSAEQPDLTRLVDQRNPEPIEPTKPTPRIEPTEPTSVLRKGMVF